MEREGDREASILGTTGLCHIPSGQPVHLVEGTRNLGGGMIVWVVRECD
jgi:hypothetical protein